MPVGEVFDPQLNKLKVGQGVRGGIRQPGGQARGLPAPMPGVPHIHLGSPAPPINMGAVAQARTRQQPGMMGGLGSLFAPLQHLGPALHQALPSPSQVKLNKNEQRAKSIITDNNPQEFHNASKQVQNLITNPSPSLHLHLAVDPFLQGQHQALLGQVGPEAQALNKAWGIDKFNKQAKNLAAGKWGPGTGVTASQAQDYYTRQQQEKASQRGFGAIEQGGVSAMGLPVIGPVLGKAQQIGTEAAAAGVGLGPQLYDLAKHAGLAGARLGQQTSRAMGMKPGGTPIPSQEPYFATVGKGFLHSYGETINHPLRQWQEDPFGLITNVLPVASGGASLALKGGSIADILSAARAGEMTPTEATMAVAKRLTEPHGVRRFMGTGPADKHFNLSGFDSMKYDKGMYADNHFPRMPIYAHTKNPEKSLFGPPGLGHSDMPEGKGMLQASGIRDPQTGQVVKINLHGKGGGLTPDAEKALSDKLMKLANEKLGEANRTDPYAVMPPTAKSALGALIQTRILDPYTVKALMKGVKPTFRAMGRDVEIPNPLTGLAQGRYGKFIRRDLEMKTQMERGAAEVRLAREAGLKGPYPDTAQIPNVDIRNQPHPGEIQRLAYGQGSAKVHADEWHNLYEGGMGWNPHIENNLQDYVAIKKPPPKEDILKNAKAYNSEANISRQWDKTIVQNTHDATAAEQVREAPNEYAFMPKRTWNQMRMKDPSLGMLQKPVNTMDNVTQLVRAGRFLHPGYIAWALQNGILHLSQAGMHVVRNALWVKNEYSKFSATDKALYDNAVGAGHFGGGIARASAGSETTHLGPVKLEQAIPGAKGFTQKAAKFWHAVDDAPFRRMSLAHELHREGYTTADQVSNLMHNDPAKFRSIARQAQREAIDYSEMSPMERATVQKMFTAWGWTRGATTYTGRFAFQHPIQFGIASQLGQQGHQAVADYYMKHGGGLPPQWLEGYLPMGKGDSPWLGEGGVINPAQTAGELLQMLPAATKGQTESLAGMESPGLGAGLEALTGLTKYGQQLKGNQRLTQPILDLISRFEPYAVGKSLFESKKGGGTFKQGLLPAALQEFGVPVSHLRSAKETGALGVKDFEQMLAKPDEINFRYNRALEQMPQQAKQLGISGNQLSSWRHDLEMVKERDTWQYHYAQAHGANSIRSLPPKNRAEAAVQFLHQYKYISSAEALADQHLINTSTDDTTLTALATAWWDSSGIGAVSNAYKDAVKNTAPPTLTPGR